MSRTMMAMENFLMNKRTLTPKEWAVDAGVAVAAFLFGCVQLMLTASTIVIPDLALRQYLGMVNVVPEASVFVALAITTLPLAFRRQFSWPVFVFTMVAFLGLQGMFNGFSLTVIGPALAIYTIASERGREEALVAAGIAVVVILFAVVPSRTASLAFFTRFQNIAFVVAAAFAGYAYRTHRAYVVETEQRAVEAERTREEEAARRVEEERVRIAREVHDITAHSLSAVSIQAAAAERLIDLDPAAAKQAIGEARTTAKNALEEIRGMIGVLRHGDDPADTEPTAGTDRMGDLVSYLEGAGLTVDLDMDGYMRTQVPAYVDVALFGIAREAATNIVRHAQASVARIRLWVDAENVWLSVEDDGRAVLADAHKFAQAVPQSGGHGIMGMGERVSLLGGTFTAGPLVGGGFRVEARIPLAVGAGKESA